MATTKSDIINSFHSSFMDKIEIPEALEDLWLLKSIGYYEVEIAPLTYNSDTAEFDSVLSRYVIDILATKMKEYYLERHYSKVNKIASIVGNDLSVNGTNGLQKYAEDELQKTKDELLDMITKLKTTAYN